MRKTLLEAAAEMQATRETAMDEAAAVLAENIPREAVPSVAFAFGVLMSTYNKLGETSVARELARMVGALKPEKEPTDGEP